MGSTALFTPPNFNGLIAELDMPKASYRALLWMQAHQNPGGQVVMSQKKIADKLNLSRSSVTVALSYLEAAYLITRPANGIYQLNAMIAGYRSENDAWDAIEVMPQEERLDGEATKFIRCYKERLAAQQAAREDKRRRSLLKVAV
ncbi:MarR family transcriptional regulator [Streptomyces sp. 8N706]|uniref:MarR family transcriptional regulator n=1 Tax=Streptomyces sp. 8N706 TaxID=3457416 RepID=UPI003FD139F0